MLFYNTRFFHIFFSNEVFNVRKARMAMEALDFCDTIQEKEKADIFFREISSLKLLSGHACKINNIDDSNSPYIIQSFIKKCDY